MPDIQYLSTQVLCKDDNYMAAIFHAQLVQFSLTHLKLIITSSYETFGLISFLFKYLSKLQYLTFECTGNAEFLDGYYWQQKAFEINSTIELSEHERDVHDNYWNVTEICVQIKDIDNDGDKGCHQQQQRYKNVVQLCLDGNCSSLAHLVYLDNLIWPNLKKLTFDAIIPSQILLETVKCIMNMPSAWNNFGYLHIFRKYLPGYLPDT
ncbi:unnamed protein product [Didymodactylos carnosus]|uniref:Uncharacterized protein n=1 Tax=Didymodactylos carnosus TaxID=1234261 RepID=A0A815SAA0_9BILA|nr:unnamed protein product [Didymodactylos carnosus]CAF4352716.1 unnamed protein product [Didymodactylos carnosus]